MTEPIRAELVGDKTCRAEGYTVKSLAPVLGMCRVLVSAGYDPGRPLNAYRGDMLCLTIGSIGEGAKLTVQESDRRGIRFVPYRPFQGAK